MTNLRYWLAACFALLLLMPQQADAQALTRLCLPVVNADGRTSCVIVDATHPLPITGTSFTATTTATATAADPSYSEGQDAPLSQDLSGHIRTLTAVTVTFPTIGAAVPATGIYNGLNVAGNLRGMTGLALGSTFAQTIAIVDASGNQITSFGSSAAVSATGAAVPASANYVGINVGGNLTGWNGAVTNAGTFAVQNNAAVVGQTASGSAVTGNPVRIGLSDGTNAQNWLTALALGDGVNGNNTGTVAPWVYNGTTWDRVRGDATNGVWVNIKAGSSSGAVAQGSTTSGQTGVLIQGAVTTSSPSYTTAQTSPLSLDTAGNLRVNVVAGGAGGGAVTVADGADVTLGTKADAASCTGTQTLNSCLKQLHLDMTGSVPAGTNVIGYTSNDVCTYSAKTNLPISQNGTSSVQLVALSGSTTIYICSLSLIAAGATTVALTTGTGSACVTGNTAVIGTTTASIANSMSLAANGGLTLGNGLGTIAKGSASSELCMVLGTNVFVSGNLTYVQI